MSPNNEAVRDGEYKIIDEITCLEHWPELKYWDKPGRKCLIVDDIGWGLSKRGDVWLASTDYALGKGEMVFGYEMAKN